MEIRKSVMGRPNLSVKGIVGSREKIRRRVHPGRRFLSNAPLAERGRREHFCSHPRSSASILPAVVRASRPQCGSETLPRQPPRRRRYALPPRPGYARRPGRSETQFIIEPAREERFQVFKESKLLVSPELAQSP